MVQFRLDASPELCNKLYKLSEYTATSVSAICSYIIHCQTRIYKKNKKSFTDDWKKKPHAPQSHSEEKTPFTVYMSEYLRNALEELREALNAKSGTLIKELVRIGISKYLNHSRVDETIFLKEKKNSIKFQKHPVKFSLSNCLYEKLDIIAMSIGIPVGNLVSLIITDYLMEKYPEIGLETGRLNDSIWFMDE